VKKDKSIANAKRVIQIERKALSEIEKRLNGKFSEAVELIYKCKGRVIVTGIGKSGIIARNTGNISPFCRFNTRRPGYD
jgi:arabinose-5-phosphate isomerase